MVEKRVHDEWLIFRSGAWDKDQKQMLDNCVQQFRSAAQRQNQLLEDRVKAIHEKRMQDFAEMGAFFEEVGRDHPESIQEMRRLSTFPTTERNSRSRSPANSDSGRAAVRERSPLVSGSSERSNSPEPQARGGNSAARGGMRGKGTSGPGRGNSCGL